MVSNIIGIDWTQGLANFGTTFGKTTTTALSPNLYFIAVSAVLAKLVDSNK